MDQSDLDITFFVPCYNEEENVLGALQTLIDVMTKVDKTYEIIVVDDCSKDRTVELVEGFQQKHPEYPIVLVKNKINLGLGENYIDTAFKGRGKYYMPYHGDNPYDVDDFINLLNHIGEADMILPYYQGTDFRPLKRRIISRVYTKIINTITGYNLRYYNGLAIIIRYGVMRWAPDSHGFGFQAELVGRLLDSGASYVEVQISNHEKKKLGSKALGLENFMSVTYSVIKIFLRRVRKIMFGH